MIRLTVRSLAELLHLPAHVQVRILNEQKYPRREPQVFKVPFYQVALRGIQNYYKANGDRRQLAAARARAAELRPPPKRASNDRALRAFEAGSQARRVITPSPPATYRVRLCREIELRVRFDLEGVEDNSPRRVYYNFRNIAVEPAVATAALQISHWVLHECGLTIPIRALEYVDLFTDITYSVSRQSQRTLRVMEQNTSIITTLWASL